MQDTPRIGRPGVSGGNGADMNKTKNQHTLKIKSGQASTQPVKKRDLISDYYEKQNDTDSENQVDTIDPMSKTSWTVAELRHTKLPEQRWAIPGFIPIGLTFLSGLPKAGKSWLSLQIAHAVGTGGEVLGVKVEKRKVLYLALEDGPHRLKKESLNKIFQISQISSLKWSGLN